MMRYYLPKALTYNLISPDLPAANLANLITALQNGINAESDWGVGVPAGPLIRWFEYSHGNIGGGKAWALSQAAALVPGRPSPFFEALDNATQDGAALVRGTGGSSTLAHVTGDIDSEWQEPDRIALVMMAGGEVTGVTMWFELADLTAQVPVEFPERTYIDSQGVTQIHTWATWGLFGTSHAPVQYGTKWYRVSAYGESGEPLAASQWLNYYLGGGTVLSTTQYQAIQAANATGV